ncbi:MAG: ParB N-terminal domain-containing protein, partial [Chloroflexota bacterium]
MEKKISEIIVGERSRKYLQNIESLAASIERSGLLHPIVISPDNHLIAGGRRLAAFKLLDRKMIPVSVARNLDEALPLLMAERDENVEREPLTPEEYVHQAARFEAFEKEAAKERQAEGQKKGGVVGGRGRSKKQPESDSSEENLLKAKREKQARDKIATAVGVSAPTLRKAQEVVAAAEAEPEKYASILEQLNKTGKVNPA